MQNTEFSTAHLHLGLYLRPCKHKISSVSSPKYLIASLEVIRGITNVIWSLQILCVQAFLSGEILFLVEW